MIDLSSLSDEDWASVQRQYRDESIRRWNLRASTRGLGYMEAAMAKILSDQIKDELMKELNG